jgi:hypothetical protein
MLKSTSVLLVEGRSDEAFFSALCESLNLSPKVQIAPPKNIGGNFNNKEGVFNHLPLLLKQFADGRIKHLGTIVDADHTANHGLGYQATVERFSAVVKPYGFELKNPHRKINGGLLYESLEGFSDLGLWVMPGTQTDGILEHWVRNCVMQDEKQLLLNATQTVANLTNQKFVAIHSVKAEVATWLAWQRAPGRGLESAITEALLDSNCVQYQLLSNWLRSIFL